MGCGSSAGKYEEAKTAEQKQVLSDVEKMKADLEAAQKKEEAEKKAAETKPAETKEATPEPTAGAAAPAPTGESKAPQEERKESKGFDAAEKAKIENSRNRGHRQGVSAEAVSQDDLANFVKPVYEKSEAEAGILSHMISINEKMKVIAGGLEGDALKDIINAFKACKMEKDQDVIRQGEDGDNLYICEAGELEVFVARPDAATGVTPEGKGHKVLTVGPGALFGELALMYSAPRAATVTVSSDTAKLWSLERDAFKALLMTGAPKFEPYSGFLKDVEIMKAFNLHELGIIDKLTTSSLYDNEEVICTQGEKGEHFYIIEEGTCSAFMTGEDESGSGEKKVKDYKVGDYFGEVSLLRDVPRRATVRATGQGCSVLSISKEDFDSEAFEPIKEKLSAAAEKYPTYYEL